MYELEILDLEIVLAIHAQQLDLYGGTSGIKDGNTGAIESILSKQIEVFFGYEKYPSVFNKAAMLWYFFTKGHCFNDGNKRVGFVSCVLFLELNGYELNATEKEATRKSLEVASSMYRSLDIDTYILEDLSAWLELNCQPQEVENIYF